MRKSPKNSIADVRAANQALNCAIDKLSNVCGDDAADSAKRIRDAAKLLMGIASEIERDADSINAARADASYNG